MHREGGGGHTCCAWGGAVVRKCYKREVKFNQNVAGEKALEKGRKMQTKENFSQDKKRGRSKSCQDLSSCPARLSARLGFPAGLHGYVSGPLSPFP